MSCVNNMERVDENLEDRELISLVRGNPLLWDKTIPRGQRDRSVIDSIWAQIGAALPSERTGDFAKTRWKSIRDQFSRELRKVRSGEARSRAGAAEGAESRWPLFGELSFLKDSIKPRNTTSSFRKPRAVEPSASRLSRDVSISSTSSMDSAAGCVPVDVYNTPLYESDDLTETESSIDDTVCPRNRPLRKRRMTVPPLDSSYTSKRKSISKIKDKIETCATALTEVCESLTKTFTQPSSQVNGGVKSDIASNAYSLILDGLKQVPKPKVMGCVAEILEVMFKHIPQDQS